MVDLDRRFSVQMHFFIVGINTNQGAPLLFLLCHPSLSFNHLPHSTSLALDLRPPYTPNTTGVVIMHRNHHNTNGVNGSVAHIILAIVFEGVYDLLSLLRFKPNGIATYSPSSRSSRSSSCKSS